MRPIGLPVLEYLEGRRDEEHRAEDYVFPGGEDDTPFGSFPRHWTKILENTDLASITPHVLRHSFASIGNDLGFTEATIAALVGHSRGTITSRYIHTVDTALIMAADSIAGYIQGLLDGVAFTHTAYALDRDSRKSALAQFLGQASFTSNHVATVARGSRSQAPPFGHVKFAGMLLKKGSERRSNQSLARSSEMLAPRVATVPYRILCESDGVRFRSPFL